MGKVSYNEVQVPPVSPAEDLDSFQKWIENNVKYSEPMRRDKIQGQLILSFTISEQGDIVDQKVISSLFPDADSEVIRVLSTSSRWKAGIHNDKFVNTVITIPVNFRLS